MRRHARLVLVLCPAVLFVAAVAIGQQRARTTIDVSEVRPGMQGYGLTVFRGTQPERFDVEVIDVLTNFRPDQDLILVRTNHAIFDNAPVVAGCSGSPIYLDGRLAGAYAYGWPFGKDPVIGVTPIRNMLVEMRRAFRPTSFPIASPLAPARPGQPAPQRRSQAGLSPYLGEPVDALASLRAHAERLGLGAGAISRSQATFQPAATPVLVGGLTEGAIASLATQLEPFGLMVLQAGGGGQATPPANAPASYVNGGAIGVQLVRGDVSATAIGTVTLVDGRRVAAFGHPMLNAGEPGLPTAVARVLHVLASDARSFKIGEPVRALGTMVQDRQSAIVIDTQIPPVTIPVRLRVTGADGAPRTEWNMEVASHRVLTPTLIASALGSALGATSSDASDVMFEATSRVFLAGRASPIETRDRGFSQAGPAAGALGQLRLFSVLEAVYGNPFEEARAERVEVDLAVRFARDVVEIVDAQVAGAEVDPGSTVPVRVVLRHFDQSEQVRVIPLPVPAHFAGQTLEVLVQPGSSVRPETGLPRSLGDILTTIQARYPSTSLVLSTRTPLRGLRFGGHVVRALPPSALDSLQLTNDSDRNRPFVTYDRREVALDQVVVGGARVQLEVRRVPRP